LQSDKPFLMTAAKIIKMSKQSVLLLGVGSFNPPTIMHLRIMELARDFLTKTGQFQVVGGILSPVHDAYGKKDLVPGNHRIEMTKLALEQNNWVKLSSWEAAHNTTWTRTRAVIDYHQGRLNAYLSGSLKEKDTWMPDIQNNVNGPITCKLVCGADVLETFNTPGLWNDADTLALAKDYGLVVISREGNDPYKSIYNCDILHENRANIHVVQEWLSNEISSTRIRRALKRQESVRYVVPDPIIEYINKEGLFQA